MKMITELNNIAAIFSVFHDGRITAYSRTGDTIRLTVEIKYLARRVKEDYNSFSLCLHEVTKLSFRTWPNIVGAQPVLIENGEPFLGTKMEILSGEVKDGSIQIACNQANSSLDFCGGELYLLCTGATVSDPSGKEYSLDELGKICQEYWDEWSNKSKKAKQEA